MTEMTWYEFVPSVASSIAAMAAAYAAFRSLSISREARNVAEQAALAAHHGSAAEVLSQAIDDAVDVSKSLYEETLNIHTKWPSAIQSFDVRERGGVNPRPLRHVLSEIGDLLYKHSSLNGKKFTHARSGMFSIVRDAPPIETEEEWERLLSKADGIYPDFSSTFGDPKTGKRITSSNAFRWAFFQLHRRVNSDDWLKVWRRAWSNDGEIVKYHREHEKAKEVLENIHKNLVREKKRIAHSAMPLGRSPELSAKYNKTLAILEALKDDCSIDIVEWYKDEKYKDMALPLVIFVVSLAVFSMNLINELYGLSNE